MGLFGKNTQTLEASRRAQRRKIVRNLENAIEKNNERSAQLEAENLTHWRNASDALKSGKRAEARREIEVFRLNEIDIAKKHRMNLVCQQAIFRAQSSEADRMIQIALHDVSDMLGLKFDMRLTELDAVADALNDQAEIEKIWDRFASKTLSAADRQAVDEIESVDEMMNALETQAASELGGAANRNEPIDAQKNDAQKNESDAQEQGLGEVKID